MRHSFFSLRIFLTASSTCTCLIPQVGRLREDTSVNTTFLPFSLNFSPSRPCIGLESSRYTQALIIVHRNSNFASYLQSHCCSVSISSLPFVIGYAYVPYPSSSMSYRMYTSSSMNIVSESETDVCNIQDEHNL